MRDVFRTLEWCSRGRSRRHSLIAGILVLVLVAQVGCAGSGTGNFVRMSTHELFPDARKETVSPSQEGGIHSVSGKVAVASGRFDPKFDIMGGPAKGGTRGALKGAVEGFFAPLQLAQAGLAGILIAPFLMPVGLVVGAVEGGSAEPAVTVEVRAGALHEMVKTQKMQEDLRSRVVHLGSLKTAYTLMVLTDRGPNAPGDRPDYRPLRQEGAQTVIEVAVESVTLHGGGVFNHANPALVVGVIGIGRWVRINDNVELYGNRFTYYSKSNRTLAEWAGDPEGFRNELNQATAEIAEKIVQNIFPRKGSN
ncbi:MAG: hypothetical protein K8G79_00210 [bacterium]|uniref:Uncharacterized protein n=1 Tax=Candidatus Methylomirabilis tolerans TaxID=3123416 RepID=A0AAJ1AG78_9BACT|nr:hypothetical protein [Candidatus Methylomirabilis sp.]